MNWANLTGAIGAVLVLIPFLLAQQAKLKPTDWWYDFLNFAGSLLLLISSILLGSIPFLIVNAVWMLASLLDLLWDGTTGKMRLIKVKYFRQKP